MQERELSRRAVVMGLGAALALVFAPLDRFMAGLGRMLDAILGRPRNKLHSYSSIEVTIDGVPYKLEDSIDYQVGVDPAAGEDIPVFSRWRGGDWYIERQHGNDSNDASACTRRCARGPS